MGEKAKKSVTESEFNMWRAIFAFSLVDKVLSLEEQKILGPYLKAIAFSRAQTAILKKDFENPQNVEALYRKITAPKDRERFCILARAIAWCEGDIDRQEEVILKRVSCLANNADEDVLVRTRRHADVDACYRQYATAGMMGLFKTPPTLRVNI